MPSTGRFRQEDHGFRISLGYVVGSYVNVKNKKQCKESKRKSPELWAEPLWTEMQFSGLSDTATAPLRGTQRECYRPLRETPEHQCFSDTTHNTKDMEPTWTPIGEGRDAETVAPKTEYLTIYKTMKSNWRALC